MSSNSKDLTDEYILSEVRKLQYLYGLKHEIRYGQTRPENDLTESVAEHIYGMHLLAHYFLPLENQERDWDALRIFSMITIHDLDEIETGDTIAYLKTNELYEAEKVAREQVITNSPNHLQDHLQSLSDEYETRTTIEAKFVKAIDAFEPLIQIYSPFGRNIMKINKTSPVQSEISKETPIKPFPLMYSYYRVIHEAMIKEGYFNHQ
jgi:5'-deoxynucleotidase YfbR-like HD superfamily hydrolase